MDHAERNALIAQYAKGYDVIAGAVRGLSDTELDARESAGAWSTRETIHHLADSEIASAVRIRQIIAEETPDIRMYDQAHYVRSLFSDRPIEPSLEIMKSIRASNTLIIQRLSDSQWQRYGTHHGDQRMSAEDWLTIYVNHIETHVDQIRRAHGSRG